MGIVILKSMYWRTILWKRWIYNGYAINNIKYVKKKDSENGKK